MGWKNIPLKDMLAPGLPAPVSVFSTRVRLLAEPFTAQGNGKKNILYVNIGNGVGANIIIDGNFVHGATNRTSEIGHIVIDPEGPLCGCGNKGCLETFISGPAIAQRIKNDIASGTQTSLTKTVLQADTAESVIEKWGCALGENDPYALNLQNDIAEKLSTAVSIAINCYDPSLVILAGYVAIECCDFIIKTIREKMKTQVYNSDSRPIDILQAQAGRNALMVGAAAALFEDFMKI
jgi:predicted NBD/HSP70 family sugar kinase